jgi:hypothetical protein
LHRRLEQQEELQAEQELQEDLLHSAEGYGAAGEGEDMKRVRMHNYMEARGNRAVHVQACRG